MPMRQGGAADGYHGWFADPVGCRSGSEYHSMRPERTRHDSRGPARADRGLPAGGDASAHCFEWAVPALVVVTDPAKRAALAGFYKQAWDAYLPLPFSAANLHFDDQVHEAQQPRVTSSAAYLAEHMADVPALVIPCITPRVDDMPMWVQACIWGSVLPQSWSFMLAARAWAGLGLDANPHPVRGRGGGDPGYQSRRGAAGCADRGGVSASKGLQARVS